MKKKANKEAVIVGIICITILEIVALLKGINGTLLTIVIATIAGVIGLKTPTPKLLK